MYGGHVGGASPLGYIIINIWENACKMLSLKRESVEDAKQGKEQGGKKTSKIA